MILYRSKEYSLYHLVLVFGGWLVNKSKIVEKLSGLYGSATICDYSWLLDCVKSQRFLLNGDSGVVTF